MIQYNFEQVKNKHKGKISFVCGLGPSFSENIDYVKTKRDDIVLVSCNDIDLLTDLHPDYWVFANSHQSAHFMHKRFKNLPNTTIVHSDSVDVTPRWWIEEWMKNFNYIGYDQRHFENKKCNSCPNMCDNFITDRLTIQEELQKFTGHDKKYSTGDTVAVHMLALSILLGCKKIYITGVDLDYKKGYFGSYRQPTLVTEFDPFLDNILKDFHIINESAKRLGVEIINLSQSSHLSKVLKTETL
jgi:hypothetical protein